MSLNHGNFTEQPSEQSFSKQTGSLNCVWNQIQGTGTSGTYQPDHLCCQMCVWILILSD